MLASYPTEYQDRFGKETTIIENDGKTLQMIVRGVEFSGGSFDSLDPPDTVGKPAPESFSFFLGSLCACKIRCDVPIWVVDNTNTIQSTLRIHLDLGEFNESRGALSREILRLELMYGDKTFSSTGENLYSSFDEQLTELEALLPKNLHLKICWTCAFSDYHWSGSGAFGNLACFRNTKEQYLRARTRDDLRALWNERTEDIQEIYLCPEYERRQPGSGLYIGEEYPGKRG